MGGTICSLDLGGVIGCSGGGGGARHRYGLHTPVVEPWLQADCTALFPADAPCALADAIAPSRTSAKMNKVRIEDDH